MQHRARVKNRLKEFSVDDGVDKCPSLDDVCQPGFALQYQKRADLLFRHRLRRLGDFADHLGEVFFVQPNKVFAPKPQTPYFFQTVPAVRGGRE